MIGIYKITNKINGRCYVGQSANVTKRFVQHIHHFKRSDSKYSYFPLYEDMRKFGIDNFTFEICCECKEEELDKMERFFIKAFQAQTKGYNDTNGAGDVSEKIRRPVYRIDIGTREIIGSYNSTLEAERITGVLHTNIINCCKGVTQTAGKSLWCFKNDYDKEKFDNLVLRKYLIKNVKVAQYTLDGQFIKEYPSITKAGRETGTDLSKITEVCKGRRKTAKGYIWKYV